MAHVQKTQHPVATGKLIRERSESEAKAYARASGIDWEGKPGYLYKAFIHMVTYTTALLPAIEQECGATLKNIDKMTIMKALVDISLETQTSVCARLQVKRSTAWNHLHSPSTGFHKGPRPTIPRHLQALLFAKLDRAYEENLYTPTFAEFGDMCDMLMERNGEYQKKKITRISDKCLKNMIKANGYKVYRSKVVRQAYTDSANAITIASFLDRVQRAVKDYLTDEDGTVHKDRLLNADETGLKPPKDEKSKVVSRKGQDVKMAQRRNQDWNTQSWMVTVSAIGRIFPPAIILKRKTIWPDDMWKNIIEETGINPETLVMAQPKGSMDGPRFLQYIQWLRTQIEGQLVLILDNHDSRDHLYVLDWCRENKILLLFLPPNTTPILQPLDVGGFGVFKSVLKSALADRTNSHIDNVSMIMAGKQGYEKLTRELILKAWAKVGINVNMTSADDALDVTKVEKSAKSGHQNLQTQLPDITTVAQNGSLKPLNDVCPFLKDDMPKDPREGITFFERRLDELHAKHMAEYESEVLDLVNKTSPESRVVAIKYARDAPSTMVQKTLDAFRKHDVVGFTHDTKNVRGRTRLSSAHDSIERAIWLKTKANKDAEAQKEKEDKAAAREAKKAETAVKKAGKQKKKTANKRKEVPVQDTEVSIAAKRPRHAVVIAQDPSDTMCDTCHVYHGADEVVWVGCEYQEDNGVACDTWTCVRESLPDPWYCAAHAQNVMSDN